MLTLETATPNDVIDLGRSLYNEFRDGFSSFEDAAQTITKVLYNELRQPDGDSTFALIRVFRLMRYEELTQELQDQTTYVTNYSRWMALMGSYGDERNWCGRSSSQNYRLVDVTDNASPMFQYAFDQLDFTRPQEDGIEVEVDANFQSSGSMTRFIHVEDALNSPAITQKGNFVEPYSIQSALGLGSPFLSGSMYLAMCFSKYPISVESAEAFSELNSYVATLLAAQDERKTLWKG